MAPNQESSFRMPDERDADSGFVMTEELARIAKEELGEDENVRESGLTELRGLVSSHPHLSSTCRTDRPFLLRFLRAQKFDVARAFAVLLGYLRMRCQNPEWFMDTDPADPTAKELLEGGFIVVLPRRDVNGRRVILNQATGFDLQRHNNSHLMKVMVATLETLLEDEENQIRGMTYIINGKGAEPIEKCVWSLSEARRLFTTCEKNLAVRHRDINLLHLPLAMHTVLNFVRHLLSPKIRARISSHGDGGGSALFERLFGAAGSSALPAEAGGSAAESLSEMGQRWRAEMMRNRKRLLDRDRMTVPLTDEDSEGENRSPAASGRGWFFFG